MADVIELKLRETKGTASARKERKESLVPGVIYGDHIDNRHFMVTENQITQLKKLAKASALFDVQVAGEKESVKAIIQNIQTDSVTGNYEHIDLYQVRMDKKLHTDIPLEFTGEAPAVKDLSGILVKQFDKLAIESLPNDLINNLEVSIESLKTFTDVIRIEDLQLPEGVVTNLDPRAIVASVIEPRSEEEIAQLDEEVKDGEGPEVTTEKKDEEGEEGAKGDAESGDGDEKPDAEDAKPTDDSKSDDKKE